MGDSEFIDDIIYRLELQDALDEALEKKLLARRPMTTLVEQGIMPEYKTSPALHVQKTKLERAQMGDMLKSRISHRPERAELVHRHILEDVRPGVDPSLCDRQRQLKRAKLADSLASQLSLRPGPLELIQKNILHTDDPVEQAVKEGAIQFRPTVDIALSETDTFDEDSNDTAPSPQMDSSMPQSPLQTPSEPLPPNIAAFLAQFKDSAPQRGSVRSESLGDINVNQYLAHLNQVHSGKLTRSDSFGGSTENKGVMLSSSQQDLTFIQRGPDGKERKKLKAKSVSKPKMAPKPKIIKFHEYKGPPASLKRKKSSKKSAEQSAYELLLEQQQVFLQWQLENRSKFSQILLPAPSKGETSGRASTVSGNLSSSGYMSGASSSQASSILTSPSNSIPGTPRSTTPRASTPTRSLILTPQDVNNATSLLNKLEGMKVNDLKQELKRRNLPVSGSKPALVERLKPALESIIATGRSQFQQPYKQIPIPHGGLIILKPSPNSQLVSENISNSDMISETPLSQVMTSVLGERKTEINDSPWKTPFFPLSPKCTGRSELSYNHPTEMLSPCRNVNETYKGQNRRNSRSKTSDFELNLDFMDIEQTSCMSPPAPPPPPPPPPNQKKTTKTLNPNPLPPPPVQTLENHIWPPHQFIPSQQTSQQILLAKAQLETQLNSSRQNSQFKPPNTARAGPKGQFIWPPVNVESSKGTVITVRAANNPDPLNPSLPGTTTPYDQPVAQLTEAFSHSYSVQEPTSLQVTLPSEPVPASELGLTLPPHYYVNKSEESKLNKECNWQSDNFYKPAVESSCDKGYPLLPATLPPPEHSMGLGKIKEEIEKEANQGPEYIIKQQQMKILELQKALEISTQQLDANPKSPKTTAEDPPSSSHGTTKLLLAQQIHNKQLAYKMNQLQATEEQIKNQQPPSREATNTHRKQNTMDQSFEALMQNKDVPESVELYATKQFDNMTINQVKKSFSTQIPQLDFNFDLLPDFPDMLQTKESKSNPSNTGENMEVDFDMDVQDWLDSLVVPINNKINPDQALVSRERKCDPNSWSN